MIKKVESALNKAILAIKEDYKNNLDKNSTFPDLGIDSIDYVEIVISCEDFLNINILEKEIDWSNVNTPTLLAKLISDLYENENNN